MVLERFADGKSLNIIKEAVDAMMDDARRDEELKGWWQSVDAYVRKVSRLDLSSRYTSDYAA